MKHGLPESGTPPWPVKWLRVLPTSVLLAFDPRD